MTTAPKPARAVLALLLAALLGLRLLSPQGFMPAFDRGAVAIVACPDYAPSAAGHHHDGTRHKGSQQPCPYAAASALGGLANDLTPVHAVLLFAAALLLGRTFLFLERHSRRERPPLRGPPILA